MSHQRNSSDHIVLRGNPSALCGVCNKVSRIHHQDENEHFFLECRHKRPTGLLPSNPGCLSLEAIMAGDKWAVKLFPFADDERRVQSAEDIEIAVLLSEADALGKVA